MLNCAIIGYGKMGKIRADALEKTGKAEIVGIYDPDLKQECPYRQYDKAIDAISDPSVEAVFVCTPNYQIEPLCKEALNAGKHVFSEKPPAFNAAGVEEVRKAETASGKILMYGFNHRHHQSILRMKSIVDSGDMGRILWIRGRYGKEVNSDFFKGWRANKELAGGGIFLDQGIHMLDLFLYLAGDFDEVSVYCMLHEPVL